MSNIIWHSKGSAETAAWLAKQLKIKGVHVTPPKDFAGVAIAYGANYTDKFKWGNRNFRVIMNDPRKVRPLTDRREMFNRLGEAGLSVVSCVPLATTATYANICNLLAMNAAQGFVACKPSGAGARVVTNQADLTTAMDAGCNRALDRRFGSKLSYRLFVVDGAVVAALQKAPQTDDQFSQQVANEMGKNTRERTSIRAILSQALAGKYIVADRSFYGSYDNIPDNMRTAAISAATALGFDFCAVDLNVAAGGAVDVLNVVTTPNLRDAPSVQKEVVVAIQAWVAKNTMTPKQILASVIADATDDEAATLLKFLREEKQALVSG